MNIKDIQGGNLIGLILICMGFFFPVYNLWRLFT